MPKTPGLYLGFDFGTQYIGMAVGNRLTCSARPLEVLAVRGDIPWAAIQKLVEEWQPEALVLGHPLTPEGKAESIALKAQDFGAALGARFGLIVHFADESFTTQLAKGQLRGGQRVDALAAALILEDWLRGLPPATTSVLQ